MEMTVLIEKFLNQALTSNLFTSEYPNQYGEFILKLSFGKGNITKVPWIAFLSGYNKIQRGIYPIFLYYKEYKILILALGISETYLPPNEWKTSERYKTVREYFESENIKKPKYGNSYVFRSYKLEKFDIDELKSDIDSILEIYSIQRN